MCCYAFLEQFVGLNSTLGESIAPALDLHVDIYVPNFVVHVVKCLEFIRNQIHFYLHVFIPVEWGGKIEFPTSTGLNVSLGVLSVLFQ